MVESSLKITHHEAGGLQLPEGWDHRFFSWPSYSRVRKSFYQLCLPVIHSTFQCSGYHQETKRLIQDCTASQGQPWVRNKCFFSVQPGARGDPLTIGKHYQWNMVMVLMIFQTTFVPSNILETREILKNKHLSDLRGVRGRAGKNDSCHTS